MSENTNHLQSVAWIHQNNNKILCVKSKGKDKFFIPGGKLEDLESNERALIREIKEELSVTLDVNSISHLFTIEDIAYGLEDTNLSMHCYNANYSGKFTPNAEIEIAKWIGLDNISLCAPAAQQAIQKVLEN